MKKSEKLKPKRKINFKCFLLAHILTLFFVLASNVLAADKFAEEAGNFFDFNQKNAYSEPFSKLIEFLNDKKNELEKYDGDFMSAKVFLGNSNSNLPAELDTINSSFVSAVFESVKSFVVDNPKQYFGTVFESVKNFVFSGNGQNNLEYKSPTSEENAQEIESLKRQYGEAIDEASALSQKFSLLQNEMEKIKDSGVIVRQPIVEQKLVERTIERIVSNSSAAPGLSQGALDSKISEIRTELQNLNTNLTNQINTLSARTNSQTAATYQTISLTNKIDSLSGTRLSNITVSGVSGLADSDIPDGITASNYLLLTGGTITGSTTISGQTNLSNATTSLLTVSNGAWFVSGNIGIGTTSPYAKLSVVGPIAAEYFHATSTTATSTFGGQTVAGFAPTLAHSFGSWSVGASGANPLGASLIINPSSAASDSNLLSLSVNGSAKFLVDAEGDVFANAVTVVGGTTLSTTTASTFTVENNTYLGDATTTDITYFNSRIADSLIPTADNALDLGDSANWLRWRTGYFGTSVGIGGTATSTGTQLTASGSYLIDSNNTLSINTTNNKAVSFGTGNIIIPYASSTALTISGNSYLGTVSSGVWNGSIIGIPYGGTGWAAIQSGSIPYGNGTSALSTTTAGTAGNVLALLNGIPTWTATSTLSTITGTLAVAKGGTGQTSFGQGWLNSDGTTLSASTSPTVNYLTATSTTATSTFPYLSVTTNSNLGTVVGGTWQGTAIGDAYLTKSGDWTGTLDTYNGSDLLARANHTGTQGVATLSNYDWTFLNNYGAINLTGSSTKPIWAQGGLNASSTSNFVYASTTALTVSGNSYLGTVSSGAWNGTTISNQYGGTGLDSSALTGIAQIISGTWSASSTLSAAFGGTGWNSLQANSILLGNGAGRLATTSAGTDGFVLGLSAGVPTWLATSTLSTITGTLAVAKGGTGQTSFGQGWLNSDGTTLSASTSPTVNYITATSTTATSTFPYLSITTNSNLGTVVGGTWQGTAIGAQYGGTGQNFSASSGLVNFYSGTASTIATSSLGLLTTNVAEGTNQYWTNDRFDTRLSATTTLPNLTTLLGLTNATTTGITSTNSWLGTIRSGAWNGTTISNQYGGTGLDSSALTGIAQIISGTWSASSTLSAAFGGTGWGNLQANTVLLGNGSGRLATTTAGTDGYVLGLSAGVPTWLATSTLSTITGTLAVAKGGTGAATLTGLLQGNGISAITGIAGTAGQFPYYNGTDTLLATSSLFLATSGNVGIGTTTPDSRLTVFNSAADSAIEFSSASGSTYKWTMGLDYSDAGKFKIASSTALGSIDRFTIDGNGYVGIGTSTPARRLDVADSGNNNPQMRLSRETNVYTDFSVAQTTGDLSLALYGANADDISLFMPDGSTGANLWVCEGAACPNGISFTGGGNLFVEGVIKYATSTTPKTRRSIILTAAGAIVPVTSGAAKTQVDGTNHSYYVLDYDASSDEAAYWQWTMPDSYDNGTIDVTYYWEAGATSGDTILCSQAKGLSANSSEDIDSALSSAVCETDTAQANANDLASITETNATSNFTAGEYITFKVFRDADAAGDTMTGDARLVKVKLEYGVAAESD